jgi:hypothetical protein
MKISLNIWLPKSVLAWMIMSIGWRVKSQCTLMVFQHAKLKGHSKNKWKLVSSGPLFHRTHEYSSRRIFFLLKMFLVLSLSLINIQAKNLCLPRFPEF